MLCRYPQNLPLRKITHFPHLLVVVVWGCCRISWFEVRRVSFGVWVWNRRFTRICAVSCSLHRTAHWYERVSLWLLPIVEGGFGLEFKLKQWPSFLWITFWLMSALLRCSHCAMKSSTEAQTVSWDGSRTLSNNHAVAHVELISLVSCATKPAHWCSPQIAAKVGCCNTCGVLGLADRGTDGFGFGWNAHSEERWTVHGFMRIS